jgi:hypothetical protein
MIALYIKRKREERSTDGQVNVHTVEYRRNEGEPVGETIAEIPINPNPDRPPENCQCQLCKP